LAHIPENSFGLFSKQYRLDVAFFLCFTDIETYEQFLVDW